MRWSVTWGPVPSDRPEYEKETRLKEVRTVRRPFVLCACVILILIAGQSAIYSQTPTYYTVGDMVFCLDASGSMNFVLEPDWFGKPWGDNVKEWPDPPGPGDPPPVYPTDTRWAFALEAFRLVVNELDWIVENDPGGGYGNHPEDGWVGIVQFPKDAQLPDAFAEVFMAPEMIPDHIVVGPNQHDNTNKWNFFHPYIHDLMTDFKPRLGIPGTPMGEGLWLAGKQFETYAGSGAPIPELPPRQRVIFLFTDGENNQPPPLGGTFSTDFHADDPGLKVHSVAFGNAADLGATPAELTDISTATGGKVYIFDPDGHSGATGAAPTPTELAKLIRDEVIEYMGFSDLTDPTYILRADESRTFDICVNDYDSTLLLSVNTGPFQNISNPAVSIGVPGGVIVDSENALSYESVRYSEKGNSQYFTFGRRFLTAYHGDWSVTVTARDSGYYDFNSSVRSDLGFDIASMPSLPKTGDVIHFEMTFTPEAVADEALEVELITQQPVIGLGNLFAENLLTADQMQVVFSHRGNPDLTPASCKYRYLIIQGKIPVEWPDTLSVVFNDLGTDGDRIAGDGVFTWETDPILVPDVYRFIFNVRGRTSGGGVFCRSKTLHMPVVVDVIPDWGVSTVGFVHTGTDQDEEQGELKIRLADSLGNILGPGYDEGFDIEVSGAELVGPLENNLEGDYTQRITFSSGVEPVVSVKYGGRDFPRYEVPPPHVRRWAFSAHYGLAFPLGGLKDIYKKTAHCFIADLEYGWTRAPLTFSLMVGSNRFSGKNPAIPDDDLMSIVIVARYRAGRPALYPFVEFGPGYYKHEQGVEEFGLAGGLGLGHKPSRNVSINLGVMIHYLFSEDDDLFMQTRAGISYGFR